MLKLLLSFVELKESLGIERASLTGIMAVGDRQTHRVGTNEYDRDVYEVDTQGLSFIINDVVMVVESQYRILSELQKQSETTLLDHNLVRLISESVNQSDEMQSLQEHIRKEFNLTRFQQVSFDHHKFVICGRYLCSKNGPQLK